MLRSPRRRPGLGHDAGAQLLAGGARRPRDGLRSRRLGCGARRAATSARRTGGGSLLSVAVAATAVLVVGLRRPEPAVADDDLLDYERAPSPSPCWRTSPGRASRSRSWPPSAPSCLFFLSSTAGRARSVAEKVPDVESQSRPGRDLDRLHRAPGASSGQRCGTTASPRGSTSSRAPPTPSPTGRPSAVLLGADGALAGGPVAGADAVATFVEEIVAELRARLRSLPMPVEPEHASIGAHGHGHGHGHDQ